MKFFSLTSVLVYALLSASSLFQCHELEVSLGHEDHCLGCHYTQASTLVLDSSTLPKPVFEMVGPVFDIPDLCLGNIRPIIVGSRSPPEGFPG